MRYGTERRLHHRALHALSEGIHPSCQGAWGPTRHRRAHDPAVATQPAIQSWPPISGAAQGSDALPPLARSGRLATCATRFDQYRVAKCELPWLCGLHANLGIRRRSEPVRRVRDTRVRRADVRRSGALALSSLADCGCSAGQRDPSPGNHERHAHAISRVDAMGAGEGHACHVSGSAGLRQ